MAGMLDYLFGPSQASGPQIGMLSDSGGFDAMYSDEARKAAAERLRRGTKRGSAPIADGAPVDPTWGPMEAAAQTDTAVGLGPGAGAGYSPATDINMPKDPAVGSPGAPDAPPSTNDPFASEPTLYQGGAPLPRPRPPEAGANPGEGPAPLSLAPGDYQDKAALPPTSTPTVGQGTPAAAPAATAESPNALSGLGGIAKSLFNRLTDPNTAATRLALASGFAGAPSFGTGMSRAFGAAVPAMAADRAFAQKQTGIADTYRALVAKGVPPVEALAAVNNPDVMKATAAKYFETKPRVPHKIGTDLGGNDIMGSFDPNTNKWFDAAGREIGVGGAGGTGNPSNPSAGGGLLAKGVNDYNPELIGPDYLAQFSPDVKSAINAYVRGDTQPTGNPRLKGMETKVKEWARKYGDDIGVPVSDALFSERRKYRTELGSTGPATAGGAAKAFNQGVEHADGLASKLEAMQNKDPFGIPSVAHIVNWSRQAFSSKLTGLSDEAKTLGQTLAGEVGKLFSGQAGGGVHEREMTRERFQTIKTPEELAGALAGTLETMQGGLTALEQRRDQVLGPNSDVNFVTADTKAKIARIESVIRRLRGEEQPATAAPVAPAQPRAPVAPPPPGRYQWDPQAGLRPLQ